MRKIYLLLCILAGYTALAQQVQKTYVLPAYNKIDISGNVEILFTQDVLSPLSAIAADSVSLNNILVQVVDSILWIHPKDKSANLVKMRLSVNNLRSLVADNGARFVILKTLQSNRLNISLRSKAILSGNIVSATINLEADSRAYFCGKIETKSLEALFRNGAGGRIAGIAVNSTISCKEDAFCYAMKLVTQNSTIGASDKAKVIAHASDEISITMDEGAYIAFGGSPKKVSLPHNMFLEIMESNRENWYSTVAYSKKE